VSRQEVSAVHRVLSMVVGMPGVALAILFRLVVREPARG
jgi:hypothetical protein